MVSIDAHFDTQITHWVWSHKECLLCLARVCDAVSNLIVLRLSRTSTDKLRLVKLHLGHLNRLAPIKLVNLGFEPFVLQSQKVDLSAEIVNHLFFGIQLDHGLVLYVHCATGVVQS